MTILLKNKNYGDSRILFTVTINHGFNANQYQNSPHTHVLALN